MSKKYPTYKISSAIFPLGERIIQLEARVKRLRRVTLIKDVLNLTKKYIIRQIVKRRSAKRQFDTRHFKSEVKRKRSK